MSIVVVVGTRPEIIKMAPVVKELEKRGAEFVFIHTGQHYDYEMSKIFLKELGLPKPSESFMLENANPAAQIGEMMIKLKKALEKYRKLGIRVGHVEAGLGSFDWRMPEEHSRGMIDHVSHYLFAPTEIARRNLL